jgi:amino acid transporter
MPEELAFARKASGLVRGLSFWDVFGMGLAFITPIYGIWYIIEVGLTLYPRANLLIAILISIVTIGWASPMVWGLLGGTMPRSGGEYIYNSRIINPAIAMGASFTAVCAVFYWNLFNASMFAVPSLAILGQYMGWTGLANFATSKGGGCILSVVCIAIAFGIIVFGMRVFHKLSLWVVAVMCGGVAILDIALTFASKSSFTRNWDAQAAKYHSLSYHAFVTAAGHAAGAPMPTTWNWGDTFGVTAGVFMLFIWTYCMAYVGGEVKRPDKTLIKAQFMAVGVPVLLAIWALLALNHIVDFNFLRAAAFQDYSAATKGYALPYSTSYMSLAYIASGANWFIAIVASFTFLVTMLWLTTASLIVGQRVLFAWGMDRMGPRWFTTISPRYGSPIVMYGFCAGLSAFLCLGYWYLFPSILTGLVAAGMQLVSVFGLTAISAIILPYRKKVAHIWDASPFSQWKVLGVPVLTIAGVVYLGYIIALFYFSFFDAHTRDITGKKTLLFVVTWAIGMIWYFAWKYRSKTQGVDVAHLTYRELPPE